MHSTKHLILFIALLTFSVASYAQEDELLDFESLEKADTPTPQEAPSGSNAAENSAEQELEKELEQSEGAPPQQAENPAPQEPSQAEQDLANEEPPAEAAPTPEAVVAEPTPEQAPEPVAVEPTPVPPPPPETIQEAPQQAEVTPPTSSEPDPQDLRKEKRFSKIFERYQQPQISDDEWGGIVSSKGAPENYSIQSGDTLWDVSSKLFGDGFYWPKVWQLNDKITNPHLISQGNTLTFTPGGSQAAPSMDVQKTGDSPAGEESIDVPLTETEPPTEPLKPEVAVSKNEIVIPPEKKHRPVLKSIPPSFPDWEKDTGQFDTDGFAVDDRLSRDAKSLSGLVSGVISDQKWASEGKVVEIRDSQEVASNYQQVIVRVPAGAQVGQSFVVFSNGQEVEDPLSGDNVGFEIENRGEIKIDETVEAEVDDSEERGLLYRATVVKSVLPVRVGDSLKVGGLLRADLSGSGASSGVAAKLVSGSRDQKQFGLYDLVFLNRGEEDGLQSGQLLNVLKNNRLRNERSLLKSDRIPIGVLKIVSVGRKVSTAFLISARDAVMVGDETGASIASNDGLSDVSAPSDVVPDSESSDAGSADSELESLE